MSLLPMTLLIQEILSPFRTGIPTEMRTNCESPQTYRMSLSLHYKTPMDNQVFQQRKQTPTGKSSRGLRLHGKT